jgi:hypothetical protein
MPFDRLDGGEAAQLLATGLTYQLVDDLMRLAPLRIYAGTVPAWAPATPPAGGSAAGRGIGAA